MGVPNGSLPSLVCVRQILSGNSSGIVPCRVYVSVGASFASVFLARFVLRACALKRADIPVCLFPFRTPH